jgi:hypothetical protein
MLQVSALASMIVTLPAGNGKKIVRRVTDQAMSRSDTHRHLVQRLSI